MRNFLLQISVIFTRIFFKKCAAPFEIKIDLIAPRKKSIFYSFCWRNMIFGGNFLRIISLLVFITFWKNKSKNFLLLQKILPKIFSFRKNFSPSTKILP